MAVRKECGGACNRRVGAARAVTQQPHGKGSAGGFRLLQWYYDRVAPMAGEITESFGHLRLFLKDRLEGLSRV